MWIIIMYTFNYTPTTLGVQSWREITSGGTQKKKGGVGPPGRFQKVPLGYTGWTILRASCRLTTWQLCTQRHSQQGYHGNIQGVLKLSTGTNLPVMLLFRILNKLNRRVTFTFLFLASIPCFENMKRGLCDFHAVCVPENSPPPY
jgi:hypothetical protein